MNISLKSKRLTLVHFNSLKPSKQYLKWLNDKEITKYIVKSSKNKKKDVIEFLKEMSTSRNFFFKIKYNNNHIGNLRIGPLDYKNLSSKYGIMIGNKKYHGLGLAQEATKLAENFIFKFLNFKKMEFECIVENKPALNIYRKLNFNEKKIKRKIRINNNIFSQILFFKYDK
tara:strand:- start:16068 stop:16580 length:513 start_codon:yes stop_codon:yes gene_type:complete